ncbi:hypothetical protein [Terasakiella sp. SH-1]|uniref:hypothetical protein n=1 Tax=Terasakiella sp. SH-1 TaxID=2560057 RepID=UPI0010746ECE|nr:hypothetical protein [Terasakiella sp. SH-1]
MSGTPCKNTFDMTVNIVISAAKERAQDGKVTLDELEEIRQALTIGNIQVEAFCHSIHERCEHNIQLDLLVPPRTNAYGRVMVQPLEKLFDQKQRRISNKQLASYFHMLDQILGREQYEQYHDTANELMRHEIGKNGPDFHWDDFFALEAIRKIRIETLVRIAHAFHNFEPRLDWFITIFESSFKNGQIQHDEGTLQFTRRQARDFLLALFSEFVFPEHDKDLGPSIFLSVDEQREISKLIINLQKIR